MTEQIYKPSKTSYIFYRSLRLFGALTGLYLLGFLLFWALTTLAIGFEIGPLLSFLLLVEDIVLVLLLLVPIAVLFYKGWLLKTHREEAYIIQKDRVTVKKGNKRITLPLDKVRGVKKSYPIFETALFGTGRVELESTDGEITLRLRNLRSPEEVAATIEENMNNFGVPFTKETTIHKDIPAAPFYKKRFLALFGAFLTALLFYTALLLNDPYQNLPITELFFIALGVFLLLLLTWLIPDYFERSRRTYTLYNDVIEYKKGFFKKQIVTYPLHHVESAALNVLTSDKRHGYGTITLYIKDEELPVEIEGVKHPQKFLDSVQERIA